MVLDLLDDGLEWPERIVSDQATEFRLYSEYALAGPMGHGLFYDARDMEFSLGRYT
jgi:hypothetical protein